MTCAYCTEDRPLSREHIWPSWLVEKLDHRLRYSEKAKKLFYGDLTIRDVCEICNNGPLSVLDSYGRVLYDKYFSEMKIDSNPILFEYDYSLLARWLLKLSFNAARASKSDHERLEKYRECLIDHTTPLPGDFSISVDLVTPSHDGKKAILPNSNRICRIQFPNDIADWCTVRLVSINSYYFWLLLQDKPDHEINLENASSVIKSIPGSYIPPDGNSMEIAPSGISTIQMHSSWVPALKAAGPPPKKR